MPGLDADRLDLRPVLLEIFAEHLPLLVVEVGQKQAEEIAGAVLEHRIMRRVERRDHRFEQMHLRILPPRHRRRQSFEKAAMRRAQLRLDEMTQRVDLGTDLRIAIERIDASPAPAARRRGRRYRAADPARRRQASACGQSPACRRAPSPWPADAPAPSARSRGPRDTSPSAPPWRSNRSAAPARKPGAAPSGRRGRPRSSRSTKPPVAAIPAFGRPQRQAVVDHAKLQPRDDIGRIGICRRSGMSFQPLRSLEHLRHR